MSSKESCQSSSLARGTYILYNNYSACVHSLPQDNYLNYAWMQAMISVLAEMYSIDWDSAKAHYDKKSMIS